MNRTQSGPTETEQAKTAAEEFRFDLIDRFAAGGLGPIDLATIAWYATAAGAGGAKDLAVNPDTQGANQARKVRSAARRCSRTCAIRMPNTCVGCGNCFSYCQDDVCEVAS